MRLRLLRDAALGALLLVLYFVSASFGLETAAVNEFATLIWIPTGLSLAFLLIFGLRFWPAVALGAFLANFANEASVPTALGISAGNTLEALAGAYLLKKVVKFQPGFNRVSDAVGLIFFAAILSTLISATIGVTSLWLNGVIEISDYGSTWFPWWIGDSISNLVIAPLLLAFSIRPKLTKIDRRYILELPLFFAALVLASYFVFGAAGFYFFTDQPRGYLIFPFLVMAAIRYGQKTVVLSVLLIAVISIAYTLNGLGLSKLDDVNYGLLNLQAYMVTVASTTLILAAALNERKIQERKKDEFISVASHELKTPLTSIKAFTQTLQVKFEKKGDRESYAHMSRVNRQVDRLNRLVVKLLDLSRIQEGRITLQKQKFVIGALIREIVGEMSEITHQKILIQGDTRTRIFADRDRIGRVLTNLLSNAVAYSPDAERIIVRVTKRSSNLVIKVQDFGVGISKDDQEHIFDRFYQVKGKDADSGISLGLGLHIAKSIIESHGGKIWVKSSANQKKLPGTTFCFTLPLNLTKKH